MGKFVRLNSDNMVVDCIIATQEYINEKSPHTPRPEDWIDVSDNSDVGIGCEYKPDTQEFIMSKPFASWILDDTGLAYKPPIDPPGLEGSAVDYYWDEDAYNRDTNDPKTAGWVANTS
tara:strand:+ start:341 stop:694 length:354 start_codon:yes stop_codon:yes gene_type:complete